MKKWNENVAELASKAVKAYLSGEKVKLELASEKEERKTGAEYYEQQVSLNTVLECDACNVKVIRKEYETHLGSKRHKKRLEGIRKRARNEERRKK